jgi:hypothetical protein
VKLSLVAVAALALAALGCAAGDAPRAPEPSVVAFVADPPPDGAAVFLRGRGEATSVSVDVVARGAPDLHGAAMRVTFDPEALAFVSAEASPAWSRKSMSVTKEGSPGQLAIAWFEKGERAIDASGETVLGTLTFEVRGASGSPLAFKTERSALVDREGRWLDVAFRGGRVAGRTAPRR